MTWHAKNLGDAMLADSELKQIKQSASGTCSLFVRYVAKHSLHCEVVVYFPPNAEGMAKKYLAIPCLKPDGDGLTTL
ncbi:MAG: hypothetical protein ACTJH9_06140 [Pseudoalteromonas sp.]|uniref:hypothetical protein n=1 Tax=unclassified Pseudoalteromonas TaxID=194690 RepID=UPI003F98213C